MELEYKFKMNVGSNLRYGEIVRTADIRMLHDMDDVIYDKKWLKSQKNFELYYMYRNLYKNESDYIIIKQNKLRYDITVIPPGSLGHEFIKTAGHYHPAVNEIDLSYTEVYQVLEGKATYILQKRKVDEELIRDFIVVKAEKGDNVIIPPDYGHVTINESNEILIMANWVCDDFSSEYDLIKKMKGMAYLLTKQGFIKNLEYKFVPKIRYIEPTNFVEYGFKKGVDMYNLIQDIDKLKFLTNPSEFSLLFSKIIGV